MNMMPLDTLDRIHVAEPQSGAVQALPFTGEQALGWTGPEQFAVLGHGIVRIMDVGLAQVRTVERFPARSAVLAGGRIVAIDGTSLIVVPAGADMPAAIGTVPRRTFLLAALAGG